MIISLLATHARNSHTCQRVQNSLRARGSCEVSKIRIYWIYLIAFEPIQYCHAHHGGLDAGVVRKRGEADALHLYVHHACLLQLGEVLHFFGLREFAERAVQAALALVKIVGAHSLADYGVVDFVALG